MFEGLQTELEEVTEALAEVIARWETFVVFRHLHDKLHRPYLRTPRKTVIQIVQACRKKRKQFDRVANMK